MTGDYGPPIGGAGLAVVPGPDLRGGPPRTATGAINGDDRAGRRLATTTVCDADADADGHAHGDTHADADAGAWLVCVHPLPGPDPDAVGVARETALAASDRRAIRGIGPVRLRPA